MNQLVGGIEAGGTKTVCAVGTGPGDIRAEHRFPTTTPTETIGKAIAFFEKLGTNNPLASIGIASFGPLDPNPDSSTYGYITKTPKPNWTNTDFAGTVRRALDVPVVFDTYVNGAALAEHLWGAAQDVNNFIYLTIGTGIGGGTMVRGRLVHGLVHPEMGHISIPHNWEKDSYSGICPFHGDCLEGMASGPAIGERWGKTAEQLPPDHPAWSLEAHYLALAIRSFVCTLSPERIILGGGVMQQQQLFPTVRMKVLKYLNGYIQSHTILESIDTYIVPPGLKGSSGVMGAIALAQQIM